jgi:ParB/RepB/Spo0J family partition protein
MDTLKLDQIYPNPDQPRKHFNQGKLEELAQSIKACGLMEPLIVVPRDDRYMIIAGERRWRACGIAGVQEIPVRIIAADDQKVAELSLLENLQREDLNVIEIATAYRGLLDMGLTEQEIAQKMGHKYAWLISERLSLLNLQPVLQDCTVKGILSPAQAYQLSRLPRDMQGLVFNKISSGKINSHEKLKAQVNAILCARNQTSFLPESTPAEHEVVNKYDRLMDRIVSMLRQSFNQEDLSILSRVLSSSANQNINRIELIIIHLNKIKSALIRADSTREVLEKSAPAACA